MHWLGRNARVDIAKYREKLQGVISGFDRLVFRGTLRAIS
jgi:hypothetical protein